MPQIREYDLRQEVKAGVGDTSRATPDDFGASTGRQLEQLGRTVNQAGQQLQRQQEQDEINEIIQNASRDDLESIEVGTRKSIRTTKSYKSVESERKKTEALNKILLGGMA